MKNQILLMGIVVLMIYFSTPPGDAKCHDEYLWDCVHVSLNCTEECSFEPGRVIIEKGTRIEWANHDESISRIVELGGEFDSGKLQQAKSIHPDPINYKNGYWPNYGKSHFTHIFFKPGIYRYVDAYTGTRGYIEVE